MGLRPRLYYFWTWANREYKEKVSESTTREGREKMYLEHKRSSCAFGHDPEAGYPSLIRF